MRSEADEDDSDSDSDESSTSSNNDESNECFLGIVGNKLMMYVMAYLLLTIIIPLDTLLFGQEQTTYVPRGQRWNKTTAFLNVI